MFSSIRLIIAFLFLGCSIAVINKSKVIRKRFLYIAFSGISLILFVLSAFLPFENLFITFKSPEEAYAYYCSGESDVELIVEGNNCDFVVSRSNDTNHYLIIPKTSDGWKIGIGANIKRIAQKIENNIIINVYQYKNTDDSFITVLDTNGGEASLSDIYNTEFFPLEVTNESLNKTFVTYYGHISDFNQQYNLTVNDIKIVL